MGLEAYVFATTDFATFSTTDLGANDAVAQTAAYEVFGERPERATNTAWVKYLASFVAFAKGDIQTATELLQEVTAWAREVNEPRPEAKALEAADQFGISRAALEPTTATPFAVDPGPQFAPQFGAATPYA